MLEVPSHGFAKTSVTVVPRSPAKFLTDFGGIDGVATVVPWPIRHELLQRAVPRTPAEPRIRSGWTQFLERVANGVHNLQVGPLITAAHVVLLARAPLFEHEEKSFAV